MNHSDRLLAALVLVAAVAQPAAADSAQRERLRVKPDRSASGQRRAARLAMELGVAPDELAATKVRFVWAQGREPRGMVADRSLGDPFSRYEVDGWRVEGPGFSLERLRFPSAEAAAHFASFTDEVFDARCLLEVRGAEALVLRGPRLTSARFVRRARASTWQDRPDEAIAVLALSHRGSYTAVADGSTPVGRAIRSAFVQAQLRGAIPGLARSGEIRTLDGVVIRIQVDEEPPFGTGAVAFSYGADGAESEAALRRHLDAITRPEPASAPESRGIVSRVPR